MLEKELEGATTRRVMRQATEVLNKEMDVLYADRRDDQQTIAIQNNLIELHATDKETWESERRDLEGKIARDRARMNQEGWILDFTIQFAICGWIAAFIGIGYGVWVG